MARDAGICDARVPMPLLNLLDAELAFGAHPLLDRAEFSLEAGERVGLIGRNGTGKSSLLEVIAGRIALDDGILQKSSGLRVVAVRQEPELPAAPTLRESLATWAALDAIDDDRIRWRIDARIVEYLHRLGLEGTAGTTGLSGGERKRAALAGAFALEPGLLLLDEPTNHLDIEGIERLEQLLLDGPPAIVVTHDRSFLDRVATRIVELDRGLLRSYPGNFAAYEQRKAEQLADEAVLNRKFDKFWAQEEVWIRKGVEARRTRNEGRVKRLEQLRRQREARRERLGNVRLNVDAGERSGKLVAELRNVSKAFGGREIVRDARPARHARRSHRPDRPERRGQVHPAAADPGPPGARRRRSAPGHAALDRVLRPAARAARPGRDRGGDGQPELRLGRRGRITPPRHQLPGRLPVPGAARRVARAHAVGGRAQPAAAGAAVRAACQRHRDGRAHQRPRHRVARTAGADPAGVPGNAAAGEPRPHGSSTTS